MSTPADSFNSNISQSEENGRTVSPMALEFLQAYQSRNLSTSPKQSILFKRDSEIGLDHLAELRQKINGLEEQRLQLTATHNEQVTNLEGEVTMWREQAERGEATRQKLEYELAVIKKALNREKEATKEKDHQMRVSLQQNQAKHVIFSEKTEELTKTLKLREQETLQVVETLKKEVNDKDLEAKHLKDDNNKLRKDKEQVEQIFSEQENLYSDAQEKLTNLRVERDTQTETVRRQLKDWQYAGEREERCKKEMEAALTKLKELEESIETERAAHLETKFNSELIQLRVRDLQGALDVEKAAHNELISKAEKMSKQISDLELMYNKENSSATGLKAQLERIQSECTTVKTRLSAEVEGKHAMVSDMSEQLQIHQQSFTELKEELKKAKKRQAYLEETYGGCMKELELLIDSVQHLHQPQTKKGRGKERYAPTPSEVLETLRRMMTDFQKRLINASKEVSCLKTTCEKINQECEQYKHIMLERDKTNKDLQKKLTVATKELEKVRRALGEHQNQATAFKVALQRAEQDHYSEKNKGQDLAEEFIRQLKTLEDQLENRRLYLHGLYERIRSGPTLPGLTHVTMSEPGWSQLTGVVQDQIAAMMNAFNQSNQKVSQLTTSLKKTEDVLHKMQEAHEEGLSNLRGSGKQRELGLTAQRLKMEKQYEKQLVELKAKAKKTNETAQHAWQTAETANSVKSDLETVCQQYKEQLNNNKHKLSAALIGCSLLLGSLCAHRAQNADLINQRDLSAEQIRSFEEVRCQLQEFVTTVLSTMENNGTARTRQSPILTFRKGVIAILAMNRLQSFASSKALLQQTSICPKDQTVSLPIFLWPPCVNCFYHERHISFGSTNVPHTSALVWIWEEQFSAVLEESMAQIRNNLGTQDAARNHLLAESAHQSLNLFISKMESVVHSHVFSRCHSKERISQSRGGYSLVRHLSNGLRRALAHSSVDGGASPYSAQESLSILKKQLVKFTKRLHSAEVERRTLRVEVLQDEANEMMQTRKRAGTLERELVDLNENIKNMVAKETFESVCNELSRALQREQEAQSVLNQQSDQLDDMNLKLNIHTTVDIEKERTIAEAVQGLSDATMDLKRREQSIHQLKRQVIHLEEEKQMLRDRTREAENTMKIKTKEKDGLLFYLKSLKASVDKARQNLMHKADSQSYQGILNQLLTTASMSNFNVKEPEASTMQGLLEAFNDAHKTAGSRISMLEEEITSHKQHITSLKKELGAVCRRERDADEAFKPSGDPTSMLTSLSSQAFLYKSDRSYAEDFAPLREAIDYSNQTTPNSKTKTFHL